MRGFDKGTGQTGQAGGEGNRKEKRETGKQDGIVLEMIYASFYGESGRFGMFRSLIAGMISPLVWGIKLFSLHTLPEWGESF